MKSRCKVRALAVAFPRSVPPSLPLSVTLILLPSLLPPPSLPTFHPSSLAPSLPPYPLFSHPLSLLSSFLSLSLSLISLSLSFSLSLSLFLSLLGCLPYWCVTSKEHTSHPRSTQPVQGDPVRSYNNDIMPTASQWRKRKGTHYQECIAVEPVLMVTCEVRSPSIRQSVRKVPMCFPCATYTFIFYITVTLYYVKRPLLGVPIVLL